MRSRELGASSRLLVLRMFAALGMTGSLAGCSSIEPVAPHEQPITEPTELYMRLTLDHPAVNLSTAAGANTLQLTATPRDALGNAMAGLPVPTFRSLDTTKVRVTAGGLVTAVATTSVPALVVVTLAVGPVTHADTAWIAVSALVTPPVLDTLSIDRPWPDSTVWSIASIPPLFFDIGGWLQAFGLRPVPAVVARTVTSAGTAITGLQVEYRSLDPAIATVDRRTGSAKLLLPGQVRLVARAMAYGIARADTVTFTVTPPISGTVQWGSINSPVPQPQLPEEVRIAPHGIVEFILDDSVGVTFDDPTNVVAPSDHFAPLCNFFSFIPMFCGGTGNVVLDQLREFPVPGVYSFHYTRAGVLTGIRGRIVVSNTYE